MTCPVSSSRDWHVPAPETTGWEPSLTNPMPRMFPGPQQFLHRKSPHPACSEAERRPSYSWLCSLPRETGCTWHCFPEGHGLQEPSHVSGRVWGACGHIAAPTMPLLRKGGAMGSGPNRGGLGGAEHTALEPARPECELDSAACLSGDQGHLSLSPSSGKWVHNGPCLSRRILLGDSEDMCRMEFSSLGELTHT